MTEKNHDYCIIMAGGIGSRLWPYSRTKKPKQFLDLFGLGRTMLQITFDRFIKILPKDNIFISTYEEYKSLVNEQLPEVDPSRILTEPVQLSTAPAIALATTIIHHIDTEANVLISPSDQIIIRDDEFQQQLKKGYAFVGKTHNFLALGVKPTLPETTYGYLQAGEETIDDFSIVKTFTEKPNPEFAKLFCKSGEFYWSTGLFLWNVNTMLKSLIEDYPDVARIIQMQDAGIIDTDVLKFIDEHYPRNRFQSIDMLILEHNSNVFIAPCTFGWADIGNWTNLYNASQKDRNGNVVMDSRTALYTCRNNIIHVPLDKVVLLQGLEGYIIVENDNILMICKKDDPDLIRRMMTDTQMQYGNDFS